MVNADKNVHAKHLFKKQVDSIIGPHVLKAQMNFLIKICMLFVFVIYFLFVCLGFKIFVPLENFHSFGDVVITDKGLKILTYTRHSWPLSIEGSLT